MAKEQVLAAAAVLSMNPTARELHEGGPVLAPQQLGGGREVNARRAHTAAVLQFPEEQGGPSLVVVGPDGPLGGGGARVGVRHRAVKHARSRRLPAKRQVRLRAGESLWQSLPEEPVRTCSSTTVLSSEAPTCHRPLS